MDLGIRDMPSNEKRCTEPPFALETDALEIGTLEKSGLGGR